MRLLVATINDVEVEVGRVDDAADEVPDFLKHRSSLRLVGVVVPLRRAPGQQWAPQPAGGRP
jgi:hypothetical protein